MASTNPAHPHWSSRLLFVLAATGSAVGLGNVWKFPYITGENGGGAFVLGYLFCIVLIGVPILMAEVLIGRRGGSSPIRSARRLVDQLGAKRGWRIVGWMGVISSIIVLSFYSVVTGWALIYIWYALSGRFTEAVSGDAEPGAALEGMFSGLLADPAMLLGLHTLAMAIAILIIGRGVREGLERAVRVLMPGLFLILLILVAYAAFTTGRFGEGLDFMFRADFSALSWNAVLIALGHAFFSLSIGLGAMMAYGSYLPQRVSIARSALLIAALDTLVALLSGLAIFPLVFAYDLIPSQGPGLIFITLPIAFGQMPGGAVIGALFFVFLSLGALTSGISLLEPSVEHLTEQKGLTRWKAAGLVGGFIWLLGIASALSFSSWSGIKLLDRNLFDLFDYLSSNYLLPLGGLLTALFVGWVMPRADSLDELRMKDGIAYRSWRFVLRYVSPWLVAGVFLYGLI